MAETQHSAGVPQSQASVELRISVGAHSGGWEYQGTRAQLEAEGVIPAGLQWPAPSKQVMVRKAVAWTAGPLAFSLRRARPPQGAGPGRQWLSGDWWELSCCPVGGVPDWRHQRVIAARRELQCAIADLSPAARMTEIDLFTRSCAAGRDNAFQAFKTLVPGLMPVQRKRRPSDGAP